MTTLVISLCAFVAGTLLGASGVLTWLKSKLPWAN